MNTTSTRRLRLSVAGIGLLMGLLGSVVGAAYASHQFNDVPNSQGNHDSIGAAVDAGIATGFTGSTCNGSGGSPCYKPGDPITRGAVAAQLTRGLGRISFDSASGGNSADGANVIAESAMTGAGATGSTGFVKIDGNASLSGNMVDCPCRLTIEIRDVNSNTIVNTQTQVMTTTSDCIVGTVCGSVSTSTVFTLGGQISNSYQVRARVSTVGANTGFTVTSHVIATYFPFDSNPTS